MSSRTCVTQHMVRVVPFHSSFLRPGASVREARGTRGGAMMCVKAFAAGHVMGGEKSHVGNDTFTALPLR